MAVWSQVSITQVLQSNRLDAEYFTPDVLRVLSLVARKNASTLGDICKVMTGRTPPEYTDGGTLQVVRSGDLISPFISYDLDLPLLRTNPFSGAFALKKGDVLVSSIGFGSIGKISLVFECNDLLTVSEVTVLREPILSPSYLFAYLRSHVGQALIDREVTGATGQQHLLKSKVKAILVPKPSVEVERQVHHYITRAWDLYRESIKTYSEAQSLLLSELGLDKIDLSAPLFYEARYSETVEAGRMDAEYFSPRMRNLMRKLGENGLVLNDVAVLARRRFRPQPGVDFQYIEIGDIVSPGRAHSKTVAGEEAPSRATWIVKGNDVITTTVRPIRRLSAVISPEQEGSVCSSGFAVLEPKDVEPEFLLVFLRLPIVCELLDLYTTASMYPAISTGDLMNLPILLPDDRTRNAIAKKVRQSFVAQEESKRLIDEAVRLVEEAILGKGQ